MTLAQQLEERGIQQGDHGRAMETARKLLRRGGYDLAEIADISGLPEHEVELLDIE